MAYCTTAELTYRYGQANLVTLTDRADTPTGTIDSDVVTRAIADADALIDGYLAGRYSLPLSAVPALVKAASLVIAYWNLHLFDPPQKVRDDYQTALRTLADIAKGVVTLDVAGVEPQGSGSGGVQTTDRDRPFDEDKMTGFI